MSAAGGGVGGWWGWWWSSSLQSFKGSDCHRQHMASKAALGDDIQQLMWKFPCLPLLMIKQACLPSAWNSWDLHGTSSSDILPCSVSMLWCWRVLSQLSPSCPGRCLSSVHSFTKYCYVLGTVLSTEYSEIYSMKSLFEISFDKCYDRSVHKYWEIAKEGATHFV